MGETTVMLLEHGNKLRRKIIKGTVFALVEEITK